ncbi:MAG: metallophosphoesterase [Planctomycetota bacterium]|nr:metallophosphoesterase [Planctomycetota bacterium]MDA1161986.1 metallophosphoesterase [Planctomycetota bacterium]
MRIGVFADVHDHLDNLRLAVERFNLEQVELVLFAGDLVSTFTVPPLRKLNCPFVGCFGDNEGNKIGLYGGMTIIGTIGEPPFCYRTVDGTRILLTHALAWTKGFEGEFDVLVYAHTHKPSVRRDDQGRLYLNPGETSGWSYHHPTIAILDTTLMDAEILSLSESAIRPPESTATGIAD